MAPSVMFSSHLKLHKGTAMNQEINAGMTQDGNAEELCLMQDESSASHCLEELRNHPKKRKVIETIDSFSGWIGKAVAVLIFPMIFCLVYEVVARYFFGTPTVWANDMTTFLYGGHFMLGAAYCLEREKHIRTDFLYEKWSPRTKGLVDGTLYVLLFFPGMILFAWVSSGFALESVNQMERTMASPWMPYVWPIKLAIPIATFLLLIQGVSELLKCVFAVQTNFDMREGLREDLET